MSEDSFLFVTRTLNENNRRCSDGDGVAFQIYNWGFEWQHYDNPVHRHSFYEICYVLDGAGEYEDEDITYKLEAGTLFASLPGHWHQIRSRTGLQLFFVAFEVVSAASSPEARQYDAGLLDSPSPVVAGPEGVTALLWRALYRHVLQHRADGEPHTNSLCALLLRSFPGTFGRPDGTPVAKAKSSSRSRTHLVQLAKRYIRDNLSGSLGLAEVSAYLNISGRHLSRVFKEELGQSLVDYVTRERMLSAEGLLKTTLCSVKEIADLTGYQSVHYFTRVFSDRYGIPPAEYRKKSLPAST
ncbi:helix-turn-helix domain-containing protein [Cohnella hashimotonis]|uniref:AraC family transcriptional regulator n=1 Tax=Cohnella hashimotonis TaxID=2826895 RepID=A0ABT6TH14_9BACL|nr:AraC family transcriptional regulator [Cohnella hashimotonis]MDI4645593.1 AraC family transcriptional regulator [Cohnella hashimotonis]